jgi:HD-GYP domain-containing protein (c-di-GMP phosphodiesterase class II)
MSAEKTLVPLSIARIKEGESLPTNIYNEVGEVLAYRGSTARREVLERMVGRGTALFIDAADDQNGAWVKAEDETAVLMPRGENWYDYQDEANVLLRQPEDPRFLMRLLNFHDRLRSLALAQPDATLLALFYLSTMELRSYSATHAMLASVMCGLTARDVLGWPEDQEKTLSLAALSMNVGMTELQDKLTRQLTALTPEQKRQVNIHPERSVALLQAAGVKDADWLDAVRMHHDAPDGAMSGAEPWGDRMARLIARADSFGARRAPRATRAPLSAAKAMQAIYFNANKQIDQAGAALIKAVGIHTPGSFVELVTGELALVLKRGKVTTTPKVLTLTNGYGIALSRFVVRDTSVHEYRIARAIERREVKVAINLEDILHFV